MVGTVNILNELHFNRRGPVPTAKDHGQRRIRSHHVRHGQRHACATARNHETPAWAPMASDVLFHCIM
jgi:hypothetical protein